MKEIFDESNKSIKPVTEGGSYIFISFLYKVNFYMKKKTSKQKELKVSSCPFLI